MTRTLALMFMLFCGLLLAPLGCGDGPCDDQPADANCRESFGGIGQPICLCDTSDSGEACTDSDECEGACVGPDQMCTEATAGTCSSVAPLFGCYCRVDPQGTAEICVD